MATSQLHDPDEPVEAEVGREPDGVPHAVVGLTALYSLVLAVVVVAMLGGDSPRNHIAAVAFAALAVPVLVSKIGSKARRERDHIHASS